MLPITFPLRMAFGGFLRPPGVPLPGTEIGIAASAIVLGAMVALRVRPAIWLAAAIVAVFAVFHGHAHGTELPPGQSGLIFSLALALLLCGGVANAHMQSTGLGPFYDGAAHFLTSAEDLLAVVALALVAGLCGADGGRSGVLRSPSVCANLPGWMSLLLLGWTMSGRS